MQTLGAEEQVVGGRLKGSDKLDVRLDSEERREAKGIAIVNTEKKKHQVD